VDVKSSILAFIALFLCFEVVASDLSSVDRKQRKLVSRFYEILEMLPKRCPLEARKEFISSVERFERGFPEFNSLIKKSRFRAYAVDKFSNSTPIKEETCLYYKEALDWHIDTEKGKSSMVKNLQTMSTGANNT